MLAAAPRPPARPARPHCGAAACAARRARGGRGSARHALCGGLWPLKPLRRNGGGGAEGLRSLTLAPLFSPHPRPFRLFPSA